MVYVLRKVVDYVHEHQLLGWVGVLIGLIGFLSPQAFNLPVWLSSLLLASGWALATILLIALVANGRAATVVSCEECRKVYKLSGARGQKMEQVEFMLLRFNEKVRFLETSKRSSTASLIVDETRIRELAADGSAKESFRPKTFIASEGARTHTQKLELPREMAKGERLEIETRIAADDCFPADDESVGKNVLFPIRQLSFEIVFLGCRPENISANVREPGGRIREFKVLTLGEEPGPEGDTRVQFSAASLLPGDECLVSWSWDDMQKPEM